MRGSASRPTDREKGRAALSVPNPRFAIVANFRSAPLFPLFSACRPITSPPSDVDGLEIRHTRLAVRFLCRYDRKDRHP